MWIKDACFIAATGIDCIGVLGGSAEGGGIVGIGVPTSCSVFGAEVVIVAAGSGVSGAGGSAVFSGSDVAVGAGTSPDCILKIFIPGVTVVPSSTKSSVMIPDIGALIGTVVWKNIEHSFGIVAWKIILVETKIKIKINDVKFWLNIHLLHKNFKNKFQIIKTN